MWQFISINAKPVVNQLPFTRHKSMQNQLPFTRHKSGARIIHFGTNNVFYISSTTANLFCIFRIKIINHQSGRAMYYAIPLEAAAPTKKKHLKPFPS
jgi:hypothetical protein